jgi:hypothetical protein
MSIHPGFPDDPLYQTQLRGAGSEPTVTRPAFGLAPRAAAVLIVV